MQFRPALWLFTALIAVGCASATKRYEQGQELEQAGKPLQAAQRYIDALKKDASLADARERLIATGISAITEVLRESVALAGTGAHVQAATTLEQADQLVQNATAVGVAIPLPADYAPQHSSIFSRAVDQSVAQSSAAAQRGSYADAVSSLERAQAWLPSSSQQAALNRAMGDVRISWARNELSNGRFRSASTVADAAAQIPGVDRSTLDAIQSDALRRGTVTVAALPVTARAVFDNRLIPELNDQLSLDYWQRSPKWLAIVNPIEAQRAVRTRGLTSRDIDSQDASALARQLGARYAVTLSLDSVRFTESKVTRARRAVKTRAGADTAISVEDGQLELWARTSWRVVEASGARIAERGDASAHETSGFHRATYAGNWRDLNLSSGDRAMFERDPRDDQDLLRKVARGISERVGRDALEALLRHVD